MNLTVKIKKNKYQVQRFPTNIFQFLNVPLLELNDFQIENVLKNIRIPVTNY